MTAPAVLSRPATEAPLRQHGRVGWLRRGGRWIRRATLAACAAWLVGRLLGVDLVSPLVQLVAFTPWVAATSVLLAAFTLMLRRWREAVVAVLVALSFVALLVPRALPDAGADRGRLPLRVLTLNLAFGDAPSTEVVGLVQRLKPDVLSLQEVTPAALRRLSAAGIDQHLPHAVRREQPKAAGTALYARFPLRQGRGLDSSTTFDQARAVLTVRKRVDGVWRQAEVDMIAAHPAPPMFSGLDKFHRDYATLPRARSSGPIRVLAGDFNATLDHRIFRTLLEGGYRDAAASVGDGLDWTWPADVVAGAVVAPVIAIDHVLVDDRAGVREYSAHTVSRTDHRAVFAVLTL